MTHETPVIEAKPREQIGKRYSQRLRKVGRLPAVIYGHKKNPVHVSVDEKAILTLLQHGSHAMELQIDGGVTETCLVKDLQFGYLGDNVIHIDFTRVNLDEEVTVNVHLNFAGQPAAAQKTGAILKTVMNELEVICKVSDIPEEIKVDLEPMEQHYVVSELTLPAGVRTEVDADELVAQITWVHAPEAEGEEADAGEGEGAEPEVITESKADEGAGD